MCCVWQDDEDDKLEPDEDQRWLEDVRCAPNSDACIFVLVMSASARGCLDGLLRCAGQAVFERSSAHLRGLDQQSHAEQDRMMEEKVDSIRPPDFLC